MRALTFLLLGLTTACVAPDPYASASDDDDSGDDDDDDPGDGDDDDATPEPLADDAVIVSAPFPAELACGEETSVDVVVRNTGAATWTRGDGYKLGGVDDSDPLHPGEARVWLSDDDVVPPGGEHTFVVTLTGPDEPGTYTTDWRMVHEHVNWFGETAAADVVIACDEPDYPLPLPDMSWVVDQVAADFPEMLADSCQDDGGTWDFMDTVVDELRLYDDRWGYNWKRGVVGDPSEDVVDYHYGPGPHEGSTDVYIIDMIVGHCGDSPAPGWLDVTQATADAGTIGMWTGRGRF